jgi:hypothetical protein
VSVSLCSLRLCVLNSNLQTPLAKGQEGRADACVPDPARIAAGSRWSRSAPPVKEGKYPQAWAGTQNNLGNAYSNLSTGGRAENLKRAIACFEAAFRVYKEDEFPKSWATTQVNLGTAYSDLATGQSLRGHRA